MVPTNGKQMGDKIQWERPRRDIHLPVLETSPVGSNFFDRQEQALHMVLGTGHIFRYDLNPEATDQILNCLMKVGF